ncbi:UNVERIFIED_CONTAM: hypothetical protein FKN15_041727 [Acipenser sinensis]
MKAQCEVEREKRMAEHERQEKAKESDTWRHKHDALADILRSQEDEKSKRQNKACQANIKSYFLCVTENDQSVRILKNKDGTPRSFLLKQKVHMSQQRATLCCRVAEEADSSRYEAQRRQTQAETQAQQSREEKGLPVAENGKQKEEIQQLKSRLTDVQQVSAHAENNYFESKIKLDRITVEKQVLLEENRDFEQEKNELRHKLKELTEESTKHKEKLMYRAATPSSSTRRNSSQVHFSELSPTEIPEIVLPRKSRKVVEYFWLPTDEE